MKLRFAPVFLLFLLGNLSSPAAPPKPLRLAEGTLISLKCDSKVASNSVKTGDSVVLHCAAPIAVEGVTLIAQEAPAQATVMYAQGAGVGHGGQLFLSIDSVQAVDGSWLPLAVNQESQGDTATLPETLTPLVNAQFPKGRERALRSEPFDLFLAEESTFLAKGSQPRMQPRPKVGPKKSTLLPRGTQVMAHLDRDLTTKSVKTGDPIDFRVSEAVIVEGRTFLAPGGRAQGHAVLANPSGAAGRGGQLVVSIDSVQAVDGSWIPVQAAASDNGGKNVALRAGLRFVSPVAVIIPGRQAVVSADKVFKVLTHENAYIQVKP